MARSLAGAEKEDLEVVVAEAIEEEVVEIAVAAGVVAGCR